MSYREWIARFFKWGNPYISIVLYICAACGWVWYKQHDGSLSDPDKLIAGIAAIENIDIGKRVNLYYQVLFIFALLFGLSTYLIYILEKRFRHLRQLLIPWSWIGFGGLILLYLELSTSPQVITQKLWVTMMLCLLLFQVFRYRLKNRLLQINTHQAFWWLALLSVSLSILWRTVAFYLYNQQTFEFHIPFCISFISLLFITQFLQRFEGISFGKLVSASIPLFFLPLLTVFADELYMILNQRGVHIFSPFLIQFLCFLLSIMAVVYLAYKKASFHPRKIFRLYLYPAILCGTAAVAWYRPVMQYTRDFFELANPANALMRIFEHQEYPIVQALSSHLLSEVATPLLYTLMNGYDGSINFRIYNFIPVLVFLYLTYRFLAKAFNNATFAFGLLFLLPFNQVFYFLADIGTHVFFFVNLWLIYRLCTSYSRKKLWILALWSVFLIVWKLDVTIPALMSTLFLLGLCFWRPLRQKLLLDFSKITAILMAVAVFLVLFLMYGLHIDIPGNFMQAKDYFGAQQAHGYPTLATYVGRVFYYHYILFPVSAFIMLAYLLSRFKSNYEGRHRFLYLSLVGLIIYYFANAQRGLVRHSLKEGTDIFISSFYYMTTGLFVYWLLIKKRQARVLFILTFIFLISIVKYKIPRGYLNLVEELHLTYKASNPIQHQTSIINRCTEFDRFANYRFTEIKQLLDNNFSPEATFIDFSHAPMLYYYTQRQVPSYFNQYLQNTVTEYLQEKNIEQLQAYDVPIVVYSHHPENHWDRLDKIPNPVRYHVLGQYIYENYKPLGIFNQHYLWIKKDLNLGNYTTNIDSAYIYASRQYDLQHYPRLLAEQVQAQKKINVVHHMDHVTPGDTTPTQPFASQHVAIELGPVHTDSKVTFQYFYNNQTTGTFTFTAIKSEAPRQYLLPVSTQYNWYLGRFDSYKIEFEKEKAAEFVRLKFIDERDL